MTVQLIILGTRCANSDDGYAACAAVAGPLMAAAGGRFTGRFGHIDDLAGASGPQQVRIMEFPDEEAVRTAFESLEYQAVVPQRDKTFENLNIILAAAPPATP
jgi:uncharacterized protein (DUF1330 family)